MSADGGFYTVVAQVVRSERLSTCEEVRWTKTSTRRLRWDGSQQCNCSSRETSERSERLRGITTRVLRKMGTSRLLHHFGTQNLAQFRSERRHREWLLQECCVCVQDSVMHHSLVCV